MWFHIVNLAVLAVVSNHVQSATQMAAARATRKIQLNILLYLGTKKDHPWCT